MRDDELLAAMWRAFQAAEHVGHPDGPMAAILAVVRAHDRDAERWRAVSAMMTHEHRGDAVGWTLSVILPGDDPDAAIDAARAGGEG